MPAVVRMCYLFVKEVETCFAYEGLERETITNPSIAYGLGPLCEVLHARSRPGSSVVHIISLIGSQIK